jgi:hypothetical protein
MSYGYQDPHYDDYSYKYVDNGNHGDNGYNEYKLYLDYTDNANWEDDEAYQPQWSEYEGGEANEHGELAHGNNRTGEDWEGGYG